MEWGTMVILVPTAASLAVYLLMVAGFFIGIERVRERRHGARRGSGERRATVAAPFSPFVSILKPLAGADDELDANLATFGKLSYPWYEVLLGVTSRTDPAYGAALRFAAAFPRVPVRVIVTDPENALNPKVAQLISLEKASLGAVLVVSDSNVRVRPDYLVGLLGELGDPKVGVVSSVVVGTGEQTVGAALENLQLGALVAPGVVAAATVTGKVMTVGKSMAMRRDNLRALGGFERVGGVLAEDHVFGQTCAALGLEVRVSTATVENRNVECTLGRTIERHTRWAKMRRAMEPTGFVFEPLLSPVVIATLCLLAWPTPLAAKALLAALCVQITGATATMWRLRGRAPRWSIVPFEVLRTYVIFLCWLRAWASRRVAWRGHEFQLGPGSRLLPAEPTTWRRVRALVGA